MVFKLQVFENVWRWLLPFTWNDHRNVHFELYDHGSAAAVNQILRSPNIHYNRALVGAIETCTTSLLSRVNHGDVDDRYYDPMAEYESDDDDAFGSSDNDPFGDDNEEDSFGFDDEESEESIESLGDEITDEEFKPPKDSEWEAQVKPKAEFVDCQCEWGLFRDRNVTMREPIRLHSGVNDLNKKGIGKVQL